MGLHQFSLWLVVIVIAAVVVKSNTTYECKGLGLPNNNGCRMGEEELESELDFLMYAHVVRILQDNGKLSINALDASQPAQKKCPTSYTHCIAKGTGKGCKNTWGCRGQLGHEQLNRT
ncbi:hypothetical protein DITRI_Ditri16bG0104700 [Diplodiscus trichospermus]